MNKFQSLSSVDEILGELGNGGLKDIKITYMGLALDSELMDRIKGMRVEKTSNNLLMIAFSIPYGNNKANYQAYVNFSEAFNCCGKAYLHDFNGIHASHRTADALIRLGELIAAQRNYSYIGFIHIRGSHPVDAGISMGYKNLIEFKNTRSNNVLTECCKIL